MYILTPSDRCTLSGIDKITDNKQHFYKQRQAKIGKKSSNQANAKQHLEDELLLFEIIHLLYTSSSKNITFRTDIF